MTRPGRGSCLSRRHSCHLLLGFFPAVTLALLVASCTTKWASGAFHDPQLVETGLTRGVSTKADARRLLGEPNGMGAALLPGRTDSREVWCYDDSELLIKHKKEEGLRETGVSLKLRQQVLLVVFHKEIFDGYLWYSNKSSGGM